MDSVKVAEALEELQPLPSLHLTSPRIKRAQEAVELTLNSLGNIAKPRVPEMVLNDASIDYFERTRSKRYGMTLAELARSDLAGEAAWKGAAEGLAQLRDLLTEDHAGSYVEGPAPGFSDFVLAGLWRFLQILDRDGDLFGRLMRYDESFPKHFAACEKWLARDD